MQTSNKVDHTAALRQWNDLRSLYESLGWDVEVLPAEKGWPDLVFTANAGLVIDNRVLLARFKYPERQGETPINEAWFTKHNFQDITVPERDFEGEGDALVWNNYIFAGSGFRSDEASHPEIAEFFPDYHVITMKMIRDDFYHIDTCLSILSEDTVAFLPSAFDQESGDKLREIVPNVIECDETSAKAFGLNLMSDGTDVVLAHNAYSFHKQLQDAGFSIHPTPITEFLKSGGGVKCLSLVLR